MPRQLALANAFSQVSFLLQVCGSGSGLKCKQCFPGFILEGNECVAIECTDGEWLDLDEGACRKCKVDKCMVRGVGWRGEAVA